MQHDPSYILERVLDALKSGRREIDEPALQAVLPEVLRRCRIAEAIMREPSEAMVAAAAPIIKKGLWGIGDVFKTMRDQLLKEAGDA